MISLSYAEWLRGRVGHQKIFVTASAAFVRDRLGRVLLQKRRDNCEWGFPGGAQELGESATDTVRRETREEMAVTIRPERLIGIYSSSDFDKTYPNGDQAQTFTSFFDCRYVGGEIKKQDAEVLEAGWFDSGDIPPLQPCCAIKMRDAMRFSSEAFFR
jgi:ADP-ribose pyrophosphatase YjhB (NUDIX family)